MHSGFVARVSVFLEYVIFGVLAFNTREIETHIKKLKIATLCSCPVTQEIYIF